MNGRGWAICTTIASATALHIAGRDALAVIYWIILGACLGRESLIHATKGWK